jgi:hypothetical protein
MYRSPRANEQKMTCTMQRAHERHLSTEIENIADGGMRCELDPPVAGGMSAWRATPPGLWRGGVVYQYRGCSMLRCIAHAARRLLQGARLQVARGVVVCQRMIRQANGLTHPATSTRP